MSGISEVACLGAVKWRPRLDEVAGLLKSVRITGSHESEGRSGVSTRSNTFGEVS